MRRCDGIEISAWLRVCCFGSSGACAGDRYNESGNGLRVHYPFEARNLDWKLADGPASTDRGALRIDPYTVVERGTDGTLMTTTIVSGELCCRK